MTIINSNIAKVEGAADPNLNTSLFVYSTLGQQIIILTEVLIETVWVLESVYECAREDVYRFLKTLTYTSIFTFSEPQIIGNTIHHFKKGGDFEDLIIVMQALNHQAKKMLSFDKKLQRLFPDYVVETLNIDDI